MIFSDTLFTEFTADEIEIVLARGEGGPLRAGGQA